MESFLLTLGLVLLSFYLANAVPTSNEEKFFKWGAKNDVSGQPKWNSVPKNSKTDRQVFPLPCGTYTMPLGQIFNIVLRPTPCTWIFQGPTPGLSISLTCSRAAKRFCLYPSTKFTKRGLYEKYCKSTDSFTQKSENNVLEVSLKSTRGRPCHYACTVTALGPPPTTTSTSTTTPTTTSTATTTTPTTTSTTTDTSTSTTTPTTTTTTTTPTTTSTTTSTSTSTSTSTTTTTTPPFLCRCGRRNPIIRIVGGQTTTVNEYPWQVGLTTPTGTKPYCGGSIVSNQWIVTAAHCVTGSIASSVNVVVGEQNWATTSETTVTQRILASQIVVHPSYSSSTMDNDIALIKLATPITFQPDNKIAPVCLPDAGNLYENVNAVVTGWGTTTSGGIQPNELQEVTVPTLTNTQCRLSYGTASITANMICAGPLAGGKDSCQGDSGGPLVAPGSATQTFNVLIGIVSWGNGCALPNYPGVYTRVTNYLLG
ncbi:clotting factor G beta subunit-like [Macrobrachium rosenbergii]|uniref:clotting factor G beta subunit-like n=1 Tax=Macrobrachium rosenbergii TaxID=79674 RepID=UPI0034D6E29D